MATGIDKALQRRRTLLWIANDGDPGTPAEPRQARPKMGCDPKPLLRRQLLDSLIGDRSRCVFL